jgi:hypothetical protein
MRLLALLPCLQVQESVTNLTQLVAASSNQHLTAPLEVGCQAGHVVPRVHTAEQESPRYVLFVYQTCCSGSLLCRQQGSQFGHPLQLHVTLRLHVANSIDSSIRNVLSGDSATRSSFALPAAPVSLHFPS